MIKCITDIDKMSELQKRVIDRANKCGAPLAAAAIIKKARNKISKKIGVGRTHAPAKQFVDLRHDVKISSGQAKQIIEAYENK